MKKYTVITKEGSKWLQPINVPYQNADEYEYGNEPHPAFARADAVIYEEMTRPVPYLGNKPEGTVLSEDQVQEVRQWRNKNNSSLTWWEIPHNDDAFWNGVNDADYLETRTAYTDAESHDTSNDDPRYPLFSHMSSEHGLTLLDSELDEIARHAAPMTGVDYWKRRAESAEKLIGMEPSNPDTYDEFCRLYDEWEQIIEEGRAYGN